MCPAAYYALLRCEAKRFKVLNVAIRLSQWFYFVKNWFLEKKVIVNKVLKKGVVTKRCTVCNSVTTLHCYIYNSVTKRYTIYNSVTKRYTVCNSVTKVCNSVTDRYTICNRVTFRDVFYNVLTFFAY